MVKVKQKHVWQLHSCDVKIWFLHLSDFEARVTKATWKTNVICFTWLVQMMGKLRLCMSNFSRMSLCDYEQRQTEIWNCVVFRLHPKNYAEKSRKLPRCTSVKECFYFEYLVFQSAVLTRKDTTTNTSLRISRSISGKITFQITSGVLRFISMILNQMSHRHRVNQKIVNETWGPYIKYLGGGEWFFQGP